MEAAAPYFGRRARSRPPPNGTVSGAGPGDLSGNDPPPLTHACVDVRVPAPSGYTVPPREPPGRLDEGHASIDLHAHVLERIVDNVGAAGSRTEEFFLAQDVAVPFDADKVIGEMLPVPGHVRFHEGSDVFRVQAFEHGRLACAGSGFRGHDHHLPFERPDVRIAPGCGHAHE